MNFNFDIFKKINMPAFYLYNPDETIISAINIRNDKFCFRFNDLSELYFEVPYSVTDGEGKVVNLDKYYDKLAPRRLIFVENIGWFKITNVNDVQNNEQKYKKVNCLSYQSIYKDIGFFTEERVYCFYNNLDPKDSLYDSNNTSHIPSVVGQLYKQLGILCDLDSNGINLDSWTITYIEPALHFKKDGVSNVCRNLKEESELFGYDFMVDTIEKAFEVIFEFDILNKAIKIKSVNQVTNQNSNIYLSFDNLLNETAIEEKADDIVTVLNCNGSNLDIRTVNPIGTNYICDFSYYMDETNHQWMSQDLINKLKNWENQVTSNKINFSTILVQLKELYNNYNKLEQKKQSIEIKLKDLQNVQAQFISNELTAEDAIFTAEEVLVDDNSLDDTSNYYLLANKFTSGSSITGNSSQPTFVSNSKTFQMQDGSITNEAEDLLNSETLYFMDCTDSKSYCKIEGKGTLEYEVCNREDTSALEVVSNESIKTSTQIHIKETNLINALNEYTVTVGEFVRPKIIVKSFIRYSLISELPKWIAKYISLEAEIVEQINQINTMDGGINSKINALQTISNELNIINYFSDTPNLLKELKCYWVEGNYQNDNYAVTDDTTLTQEIEMANQLYDSAKIDLNRVSQPKFSVTASAVNFIKIYEYKNFAERLNLGEKITIEKSENLFYYPLLTEMNFSFENDDFELTFSNALKSTDALYVFSDLVTSSSKTSRTVNSNWSELTKFSRKEEKINDLLQNPLDLTLRTAQSNMFNQEFIIDSTGILGRKHKTTGDLNSYENQQMRVLNNLILFTDDSWNTIKTALGNIAYYDEGVLKTAYGLSAEVLVGSLLMGETLKIKNQDSSVVINENGITILNPKYKACLQTDENAILVVSDSATPTPLQVKVSEVQLNNGAIPTVGMYVKPMGEVLRADKNGNINLGGNITWNQTSSPVKGVYCNTNLQKPEDNTFYNTFPTSTPLDSWHKICSENDFYASYTYDGGATWTTPIRINAIDGANGINGADGANGINGTNGADGNGIASNVNYYGLSNSSLIRPENWSDTRIDPTSSNPYLWCKVLTTFTNGTTKYSEPSVINILSGSVIFNELTNGGEQFGLFNSEDNKLYINAEFIKTGSLVAGTTSGVYLTPSNATWVEKCNLTTNSSTENSSMYIFTSTEDSNYFKINYYSKYKVIYDGYTYYPNTMIDESNDDDEEEIFKCSLGNYDINSNSYFTNFPFYIADYTYYRSRDEVKPGSSSYILCNSPGTHTLAVYELTFSEEVEDKYIKNNESVIRFWAGDSNPRNANFYVTEDGKMVAKEATIEGNIKATSGQIGAFSLSDDGYFISNSMNLTPTGINFLSQGYISLGNDFSIINNSQGGKIITSTKKDFEISNGNGAGILLKAGDVSSVTNINLTLSNFSLSTFAQQSVNRKEYRTLNFHYSFSNAYISDSLLDVDLTIYTTAIQQRLNRSENFEHNVTFSIQPGNNSGDISVEIYNSNFKYYCIGQEYGELTLTNVVSGSDELVSGIIVKNNFITVYNSTKTLYSLGSFSPNVTEEYYLGSDSYKWKGLFLKDGVNSISDIRYKKDIELIPDAFDKFFDNLTPKIYRLKDNDSERKHIGYIAQEIESSLEDAGLDTKDFAGICIGKDEEETRTLRYQEFIALNTYEIQKLKKRVAELESKIQ